MKLKLSELTTIVFDYMSGNYAALQVILLVSFGPASSLFNLLQQPISLPAFEKQTPP